MGAGGLCRCASSSIHLVPLQDAYLQQHRPAEQARMDSSVSQRENRPDLKKQRSHSFPTLYLPPHRCGRNKAGWNLSKYCLLNLPFHFSAGCCCCCWFTSAVQTVLSSGQSLLTVLPTAPHALPSIFVLSHRNKQPKPVFLFYFLLGSFQGWAVKAGRTIYPHVTRSVQL